MKSPLFEVRTALQQQGLAQVAPLARQLNLTAAVVEDAIAHWQARGKVRPYTPHSGSLSCGSGTGCGGCGGCNTRAAVLYEWVE